MGFLKAILVLLLIYYLVKIVIKLFAPKLFAYAAKKTEAHFKEKFDEFNAQNNRGGEQVGDVIFDKKSSKKNGGSEKVGEYIDFEEVD